MKHIISNQQILEVAKLYKAGLSVDAIVTKTGCLGAYSIICKLRNEGARLPKRARNFRDWAALVQEINK